jgi:5,10-methylenetetrahydrofolate reductase
MTAPIELDLKQRLARLSERDQRAMSAYLLRLKHQSKSGRQDISKLMQEMDAGEKIGLTQLATDLGHGC